ncbi:MAG: hypothetical protein IJG54_07005 [Bacteroidales bacterium]|nr:hypothetical protein [Bacteroidales bacterium]
MNKLTFWRDFVFLVRLLINSLRRHCHLLFNNQLTGCGSHKLAWGDSYMAQYFVRNLREGGRPAPTGYSSWLDYWEKKTGLKANKCHYSGCSNVATDGAHVQLVYGSDEWYIVPLCHRCNTQYGACFYVEGPLVPVNPYNPIKW